MPKIRGWKKTGKDTWKRTSPSKMQGSVNMVKINKKKVASIPTYFIDVYGTNMGIIPISREVDLYAFRGSVYNGRSHDEAQKWAVYYMREQGERRDFNG